MRASFYMGTSFYMGVSFMLLVYCLLWTHLGGAYFVLPVVWHNLVWVATIEVVVDIYAVPVRGWGHFSLAFLLISAVFDCSPCEPTTAVLWACGLRCCWRCWFLLLVEDQSYSHTLVGVFTLKAGGRLDLVIIIISIDGVNHVWWTLIHRSSEILYIWCIICNC